MIERELRLRHAEILDLQWLADHRDQPGGR
jgi:hypothetical protein